VVGGRVSCTEAKLSYVTHTDYLKFPSGRTVSKCRKDARKLRTDDRALALHTALDIVAKDNGIPGGWTEALDTLLVASLERVRISKDTMSIDAIISIAKRNPSLTQYGLGIMWAERASMLGLTVEELQQREHDSLPDMLTECARTLAFVSLLLPQRAVNSRPMRDSYELKHVAERVFGYVTDGIYVPHGAFIVAALFQGFLPQRCAPRSAFVYFNIDEESPILHWKGNLDSPIAYELKKRLEFYSCS